MAADVPLFDKDKHVKYWLRCLRLPLPTAYTSNDAHRMTMAFFVVSALDILGVLFTRTTPEERFEYIDWIYGCQHPLGGFRGSPEVDDAEVIKSGSVRWDFANLAATFFAINALCILGDDLRQLRREKCLAYVASLQRSDGGFAELKDEQEQLIGGGDPRFAYMAASIRWILTGHTTEAWNGTPDIDIRALQGWLRRVKTRDNGFASDGLHETQAGLTFCALAARHFLDRSETSTGRPHPSHPTNSISKNRAMLLADGTTEADLHVLIEWLVNLYTSELNDDDYEMPSNVDTASSKDKVNAHDKDEKPFRKLKSVSMKAKTQGRKGLEADAFLAERTRNICWAGFAGRCNKVSDTCYVFWAGASLKLLQNLDLIEHEYIRSYLIEKTQHMMLGGFGKWPEDLPDMYHSYLGLAALALIDGHKQDGYQTGPEIEIVSKDFDSHIPQPEAATQSSDSARSLRALDPTLSLGNYTNTLPIIRNGGNTQDFTIFEPDQTEARIGIFNTSVSQDYPLDITIGPSYFESYNTWPDVQFVHGFDLGRNGSAARTALLESVEPACKALEGGKLFSWELGNEPDLFKTSSQGPKRPADWDEQDYVDEWLNGTRAIKTALQTACPDLATDENFMWMAPSFAGTSNSLNIIRTFQDGIDADNDIKVISSHNYISGATTPGVTLQKTLMNHTSTVASIRPHVNESMLLSNYTSQSPYLLGETNSLYNEGAPGLSNSFGAALWNFDFNLHCAAAGINRVHMHQGTDYRYAAWQPVDTNKTTKGTKPPFYGQIGAAAAVGDLSASNATVEELTVGNGTYDSAYAIYSNATFARLAAVNLREYNYSLSSGGAPDPNAGPRPSQTYTFSLPTDAISDGQNLTVQRLMANGSDAITGVTFDGISFNYELDDGRPVALGNATTGEMVMVTGGAVSVEVADSSAVVLVM
ncbi:MAG: hypothetical protein Q9159_006234 [Coniocarpon cinnabarinum]